MPLIDWNTWAAASRGCGQPLQLAFRQVQQAWHNSVGCDGYDNSSRATLKQAIDRAERGEVVLYVVLYAVSTRDFDPADDLELPGNHALRVLAERTGGSAFFPGSLGRLNRALTELQHVIRSPYLIGYKPAAFCHDGCYRAIGITAAKSGRKLTINCRKGYYTDAGGPKSN